MNGKGIEEKTMNKKKKKTNTWNFKWFWKKHQ